jgi:hypothetical protein
MKCDLGPSDVPKAETQGTARGHKGRIIHLIFIVIIGLGMQDTGQGDQADGGVYSDSHECL